METVTVMPQPKHESKLKTKLRTKKMEIVISCEHALSTNANDNAILPSAAKNIKTKPKNNMYSLPHASSLSVHTVFRCGSIAFSH